MKVIIQHDRMDCGPACLAMIASHYKKSVSIQYLRDLCNLSREGVSIFGITTAAEALGFSTYPLEMGIGEIGKFQQHFPCILHWDKNHFVVLKKIWKNPITGNLKYYIVDPGHGAITFTEKKMAEYWLKPDKKGILLLCVPNENFDEIIVPAPHKLSNSFFINHLLKYKKSIIILFVLLLLGNILNVALPFLTQNLIDKGVIPKNINLVMMVLISQFLIFNSASLIEIFRNWITLSLGTKLSISIISDFLQKMLKLPIVFFETRLIGDLSQRISDNERIEEFLTSQSLLTFFSLITFLVFLVILAYYNINIFIVFSIISVVSITWSIYWLNKKRNLNYIRFRERSMNHNAVYELIVSVSETKLNSFENYKLNKWKDLQLKLFDINKRTLKVDQLQASGFEFFNQTRNIIISFMTAMLVIDNKLTLGGMLAISFIIGQLNAPFSQFIGFIRSFQFAKLSAERLEEVNNEEDEERPGMKDVPNMIQSGIVIENLRFSYDNYRNVLDDINLTIPYGKVTAIVGSSGSGKTTLLKLLLKFYTLTSGSISVNSENIDNISPKNLRNKIGTVMQDGFIYSETLARNIAMGDQEINLEKLNQAIHIANLYDFIDKHPLGIETPLGHTGNNVSGGEKQRILIARAVYKNPDFIFLDEATSALDAENERIIHENLQSFFKGKTVVIIAHRLSTVKNANQIIVLKNGGMVEQGNHQLLIQNKADYFNLVKNQLELGM
nr:peptidase domain-containing ABC transporter [uncultured Chryseobacterium sp.]